MPDCAKLLLLECGQSFYRNQPHITTHFKPRLRIPLPRKIKLDQYASNPLSLVIPIFIVIFLCEDKHTVVIGELKQLAFGDLHLPAKRLQF